MTRLELFKADHLDCLDLRQQEIDAFGSEEAYKENVAILATRGVGTTLISDGRILAIIGYYEMWPGVFTVFVMPSKYLPDYRMVFARTVKRLLASIEVMHKPHRIQTECTADELHDSWMRYLGFTMECERMRKFTRAKADCRLWARVYGDD